jgi:hypothetical protein
MITPMQVWCERGKPQTLECHGIAFSEELEEWSDCYTTHMRSGKRLLCSCTYLPFRSLTQFLTRLKQTSINTQPGDNYRKSDRLLTFSLAQHCRSHYLSILQTFTTLLLMQLFSFDGKNKSVFAIIN